MYLVATKAPGAIGQAVPLSCDTLFIDTDRGHVEVRTGSGSDVHVRVSVSRGDLADYLELSFDESSGLRIEGRKVRGVSETVLSRGKVVVDKGSFKGSAGAGRFIRRDPRPR